MQYPYLFVAEKTTSPEDAGMKAAEKVAEEIMDKAKLNAEHAAKLEAKKEIDKILNIDPLPPGVNHTGKTSRYVEDIHIHEVIGQVLSGKKKITASFWSATGGLRNQSFSLPLHIL